MNRTISYQVLNTAAGWVGIAGSPQGLVRATLPCPSPEAARSSLGAWTGEASFHSDDLKDVVERLRRYFAGERVTFPDKLDPSAGTSFQSRVWETAREIPYGETRSYGWIARQLGKPKAARAVGQALGRNPLAIIIPCHRVVAGDGGLCGFGGGLDAKRRLLRLEGSIA